ncbi:MAG: hypothetical protein AVDCRST_MAG24-1206, partial [uncultured Nocardioidaceae bacterium]
GQVRDPHLRRPGLLRERVARGVACDGRRAQQVRRAGLRARWVPGGRRGARAPDDGHHGQGWRHGDGRPVRRDQGDPQRLLRRRGARPRPRCRDRQAVPGPGPWRRRRGPPGGGPDDEPVL